MSNNRVYASTHTTNETVVGRRAVLRGVYYSAGTSAGSVVLKDGGASGTTRLNLATPGAANSGEDMVEIPGDGILFDTDVHVTITNVDSVTVFYS
jgi:hypothetical protein